MQNNSVLNSTKYSSNTDEWYTPYELVEEEILKYSQQFKNTCVLCNCDDPFESSFSKYFIRNFNKLKLKKLVCTSYENSKVKGTELKTTSKAYILTLENVPKNIDTYSDKELMSYIKKSKAVKELIGTGDFSSKECLEELEKCDIVVTNPPFSKFSKLFELIMKYEKKFLLIGNQNAILYKEVFPYIVSNKVWIGYRFGEMSFMVPEDTEPHKTRFWVDENGQKWRSLGNAMWLTNLDNTRRHQELKLTQTYKKDKYEKFDNYNCIFVKSVADIPKNYKGLMAVPLTFLKYYNPKQFEIIGEANHGSDSEYDLFKPIINGKEKYKRLVIRRKTNERV